MNNLYIDASYASINKYGESLCGDRVQITRKTKNDEIVMVLADGLGSGVKANILATLTSKIISTMMANEMSIEDCIKTIANTLPVCEERKIAYSTFTIIKIDKNLKAHIIEYDNPQTILLRNGKNYIYQKSISEIGGKAIYQTKIQLQENDTLISMSDGALYASVGMMLDTKSWRREDIVAYLEEIYLPSKTAQNIQMQLLEKINNLYGKKAGDDTTISVLKAKKRKTVDIMVGPPAKRNDDNKMLSLYFSKKGYKIVCGGTTASIVAKYLNAEIVPVYETNNDDIPPMSTINGVDLVTEGIVTLNKVLHYIKKQADETAPQDLYNYEYNPASKIAKILIEEATDINFFVGKAINYEQKNSPEIIEYGIKQNLIDNLVEMLKKQDKSVNVYMF